MAPHSSTLAWKIPCRNGMDLTEAEDIKKRWQKYTEKLYKKDLHDPDNHDGVITHLEPDILECEVNCALGKVKGKSLSHVQLFATPWTVAYHAPLTMGFSRQEYWSGLPFPFPEDLPNPGFEPGSPAL